jgi:hypothetical protein
VQIPDSQASQAKAQLGDLLFTSGPYKSQALIAGQAYRVKLVDAMHYQVLRESGKGVEPAGARAIAAGDGVLALRQGDDLLLRYPDGTSLSMEDFYTVCTDAAQCTLTLPGEAPEGYTVGADAAQVATDGAPLLVYAYGEKDLLV